MTPYWDKKNWINIDSSNGMLPVGTKPLPDSNVDMSLRRVCGICLEDIISKNEFEYYTFKMISTYPRGKRVDALWDMLSPMINTGCLHV